ncbi:MAG: hypothetical protein KME21_20760 [Desmonostoc vinosum HA7617-LM4]|nr:hypothetical protein [Desmonostoc vinosum HA7617-LM4]
MSKSACRGNWESRGRGDAVNVNENFSASPRLTLSASSPSSPSSPSS